MDILSSWETDAGIAVPVGSTVERVRLSIAAVNDVSVLSGVAWRFAMGIFLESSDPVDTDPFVIPQYPWMFFTETRRPAAVATNASVFSPPAGAERVEVGTAQSAFSYDVKSRRRIRGTDQRLYFCAGSDIGSSSNYSLCASVLLRLP